MNSTPGFPVVLLKKLPSERERRGSASYRRRQRYDLKASKAFSRSDHQEWAPA